MRRSSILPLALPVALAPASAVAFGAAAPAFATTTGPGGGGPAPGPTRAAPGLDRAALREAIAAGRDDGATGVVAEVTKGGETWRGASGDVVSGQRVSREAHFRIGSISKPMEAVFLPHDEEIERRLDYLTFDEIIRRTLRPDGSVLWSKTGSDPGYRSGVFASEISTCARCAR